MQKQSDQLRLCWSGKSFVLIAYQLVILNSNVYGNRYQISGLENKLCLVSN